MRTPYLCSIEFNALNGKKQDSPTAAPQGAMSTSAARIISAIRTYLATFSE